MANKIWALRLVTRDCGETIIEDICAFDAQPTEKEQRDAYEAYLRDPEMQNSDEDVAEQLESLDDSECDYIELELVELKLHHVKLT